VSADQTNTEPETEPRTRRRFLLGATVAGLAAISAACSDDGGDGGDGEAATSTTSGGDTDQESDVKVREGDVDGGRDPNNPTAKKASAALAEDLEMATFAAGLEALAVSAYRQTAAAATAGQLGEVPPAVAEFVTTVMGHHQAALDQWNRALAISGKPQVTTPDRTLQPTVDAALKDVGDVPGAARLALMLEDIASATYLAAIPKLKAPESIALAASIQPIDMQHAAILHFVLGEYPVPDVFAKTDQAVAPA